MSEAKIDRKSDKLTAHKIFYALLLHLFIVWRIVFDWFVDFIISFKFDDSKSIKIPPPKKQFLLESASSVAAKIRKKELTAEEVVRATIDRVKEVNPILNAVVDNQFEEAIKEAQEVDAFLRTTSLSEEQIKEQKPFLGVPFTNKESTMAKGQNFSLGLVARRGVKGTEDSSVCAKYKDSGAILIATTNVPELNLWTETRNNNYGMTVNPYNTNYTVGGSSGGEGSIIAACGSFIGLGTDIGGSCRMPAYYCGIFAHKPTTGLISTRGLGFRQEIPDRTMVCAGPMVRFAEDLAPVTKTLYHYELEKFAAEAKLMQIDKEVAMKDIKFYYIEDPLDPRVSPVCSDVKSVIRKAVDFLAEASGRPAVKLQVPEFKYSLTLWRYWMTKEIRNGVKFATMLGNKERTVSALPELFNLIMGKSEFTLPAILKIIDDEYLPSVPAPWAEEMTEKLKNKLMVRKYASRQGLGATEILGDDGVLIFPSNPHPAGLHYSAFLRPYNFAYWAIFNVLELPATQVPMGLTNKGLPVGFQVVAKKYNDHLTISVAKALEKQFGGYVPPFSS